jgi:hypothetical protein
VFTWGTNKITFLSNIDKEDVICRPKLLINLFGINITNVCTSDHITYLLSNDRQIYYYKYDFNIKKLSLPFDDHRYIDIMRISTHKSHQHHVCLISNNKVYVLVKVNDSVIETKYTNIFEFCANCWGTTYHTIDMSIECTDNIIQFIGRKIDKIKTTFDNLRKSII